MYIVYASLAAIACVACLWATCFLLFPWNGPYCLGAANEHVSTPMSIELVLYLVFDVFVVLFFHVGVIGAKKRTYSLCPLCIHPTMYYLLIMTVFTRYSSSYQVFIVLLSCPQVARMLYMSLAAIVCCVHLKAAYLNPRRKCMIAMFGSRQWACIDANEYWIGSILSSWCIRSIILPRRRHWR